MNDQNFIDESLLTYMSRGSHYLSDHSNSIISPFTSTVISDIIHSNVLSNNQIEKSSNSLISTHCTTISPPPPPPLPSSTSSSSSSSSISLSKWSQKHLFNLATLQNISSGKSNLYLNDSTIASSRSSPIPLYSTQFISQLPSLSLSSSSSSQEENFNMNCCISSPLLLSSSSLSDLSHNNSPNHHHHHHHHHQFSSLFSL
ncbi:unnamed protein product [Schistosoma curassoni]|uniref:Uncharacterized protein n=1 Tax=Schistosoma curassoni TaxID=6186 RepID=A0A183L4Q3_9TREM|nr:unnamed protein product [Schistosoma curassoni]